MSVADLVDVGQDLFAGYCCSMPPSQLPVGASPNCQDVIFPMGAVRSRPRLSSFFPSLGGNPTVNGLKTYANALANIMLAWDSLGNLYQEATPNNLTLVKGGGVPGLFYNSTSLFGREYMAFFDGKSGQDIPRQFDGTNYDRVSQVGPGQAPSAADENISINIVAAPVGALQSDLNGTIVASPNGLSEAGNIVTVNMSFSQDLDILQPGDSVIIAGAGVAGYNGTFKVLTAVDGNNKFTYYNPVSGLAPSGNGTVKTQMALINITAAAYIPAGSSVVLAGIAVAGYNGTWSVRKHANAAATSALFYVVLNVGGLADSGNGTVVIAGNITAALRGVSVAFITRQGFITCPAAPNFWTAAGAKRVAISNIPIGPPNVVARLLLFTQAIIAPAVTGPFFSLPIGSQQVAGSVMLISDNTTTTLTLDFLDSILVAGFNAQYLFSQIELGECASVNSYNSRTVWLGERNKVKADGGGGGFTNLTFDGGFGTIGSGFTSAPLALGWTPDANNYAGGTSALTTGRIAYWGDAYALGGDGVTAIRGKMTQTAYKDYLGNQMLSLNTSYSVRARVARDAALVQGTLHINMQSTTGGFTTTGLTVTAAQAGLAYVEFTAVILTAQATIPSDLLLQIYADGTPTALGAFLVDCIEIFPTNSPVNLSLARISHANNPESFDGLLDVVQIAEPGATASIQMLRASWKIRTNLYLTKDHYLCYVTDDGVNEPASWTITEVSNTIGCCGPNAWDGSEEWVVFAERSGLYLTSGSDPIKIMQEIQEDVSATGKPNWNATNWLGGYKVWVRVQHEAKRILVGLPTGEGIQLNQIFHMDYKFSPTGEAITSAMAPTYSAFTGRILVHGSARKWSPWTMTANCCAQIERPDGTSQTFLGNGVSNGKIYELVDAATQGSDDGVAVNDFYETYGNPSKSQEDEMQLRSHRKICEYVTGRVTGSGILTLQATSPYRTTNIRSIILSLNPAGDFERKVSIHGERIFWTVGTNAIGHWFMLERLIPSLKADPVILVRGLSA